MKSLKSKIKKVVLALLATTLLLVIATVFFIYKSQHTMSWEYPTDLSDKTETIEVSYIMWACACANWLPSEFKQADIETHERECIYIEAANDDLIVPDSLIDKHHNSIQLRLTGSFYNNTGISRTYESPTSQKPEKAKVFRYTRIEVLRK